MNERRDYYVYGYVRLDTNTYFYIGKGTNNRYKRIDLRSNHFKNIINSVDCAVEIIKDNLTEEEALDLEQDLIESLVFEEGYTIEFDSFQDKNEGFNHLVNCTYGGEGISGYKHTEETIKKCVHYGKNNGMYGKKGELSPHYGKKYSEDHKEKIKLSNPKRKKVYCIELDIEFNSYREAEKILLENYNIVCSHASISAICRGLYSKGGYYNDTMLEANLHFININN